MKKKNEGFIMIEAMLTIVPMILAVSTTLAVGILYYEKASLQLSANIMSDKIAMTYYTAQTKDLNKNRISSKDEIGTVLDQGLYGLIERQIPPVGAPGLIASVLGAVFHFRDTEFRQNLNKFLGEDYTLVPDRENDKTFKKPLTERFVRPINIFSSQKIESPHIELGKEDGIGRRHVTVTLDETVDVPFYNFMHYLKIVNSDQCKFEAVSVSNSFFPSYAYNTLNFADHYTHYLDDKSEILQTFEWIINFVMEKACN
ncbi:MAG: hypothetical protein LBN08_06595 [Lactobacillales bacterium]|jgi:hypothetical protein|nr:hypothetical protein [Lactobacillales bacterium]